MSRRRNTQPDESSLEILLDTVCNTLGVIVFISMLLVVQVNDSLPTAAETPASHDSSDDLHERQAQLEESRNRIEQLQEVIAQQRSIVDKFASDESRQATTRLNAQSLDEIRLAQEKNEMMSSVAAAQDASNQAAIKLAEQTKELKESRQEAILIQQALAAETQKRTKSAEFPEGRPSTRETVGILLKGGEMFRIQIASPDVVFNSQEVRKVQSQSGIYIEPIIGKGLRINTQTPNSEEISQRLRGYSGSDHVLRVFFWPDSFAEFQVLRDSIVQLSLAYSPEPVPEQTMISFGVSQVQVYEQ